MSVMYRRPELHRRLRRWYRQHGRVLSWRQTSDPYLIAVSEVMLQQTPIDRVIPKFAAWRRRFPTINHLSRSPLRTVLRLWSGLGYNRRAKYVLDLSKTVVRDYSGRIPQSPTVLRKLPGVGPYTAAAIQSFAFGRRTVVIDTNIRRIIHRLFFGVQKEVHEQDIHRAAAAVLPARKTAQWHQALMDLGARVCKSRKPQCAVCPLRQSCRAYPDIVRRPPPKRRENVQPFTHSDRYLRGFILKTLVKKHQVPARSLFRQLPESHRFSWPRFRRVFESLRSEGLVQTANNLLTLPR